MGRDTGSWKNEPRSVGMVAAEALRHQHLDRLAEHLVARVAEHALGLRVDHLDLPLLLIITIALGADSTT